MITAPQVTRTGILPAISTLPDALHGRKHRQQNPRGRGAILDRATYHADSAHEECALSGGVIWKLERAQFFNEVDDAWDAFVAGDWARVMEIFESERAWIRRDAARYTKHGLRFRRVRVVEHPPTPYLRWESHSHRIFVECGHAIRALEAAKVAHLAQSTPLPELMLYGHRVLYHVRYDDRWTPIGAKRIDDRALVAEAEATIAELWEHGEPFNDYFHREIAPLPIPGTENEDTR